MQLQAGCAHFAGAMASSTGDSNASGLSSLNKDRVPEHELERPDPDHVVALER